VGRDLSVLLGDVPARDFFVMNPFATMQLRRRLTGV
jgi:hypothetical protein